MTLREFILARSLLPKTGVHTMKEHLVSVTASFLATAVGAVTVSSTNSIPLVIDQSTTEIVVERATEEIVIAAVTQPTVVDGVNEINIEIDCNV